jgi:hypothetical protein
MTIAISLSWISIVGY